MKIATEILDIEVPKGERIYAVMATTDGSTVMVIATGKSPDDVVKDIESDGIQVARTAEGQALILDVLGVIEETNIWRLYRGIPGPDNGYGMLN